MRQPRLTPMRLFFQLPRGLRAGSESNPTSGLQCQSRLKKTSTESSLGSHGIGVRNDRGNTLVDFCEANGLRIWNTYFKKRGTRKWTWKSPDGVTKNCIDYVIADRRCPIYDVDVIANLHFDTDHRLVRAKMKIVSRHVNKRATSKRVFDKPLFSYAVERLFNQNSPETYECLKKVFSEASTIATTYEPIPSRFSARTEKLFLKRQELQSQTHTPSGRIEFCMTNKALRVSIKNDTEMNLHNKIDRAIKKHRSVRKALRKSKVCSIALTQLQRVDGTIAASKEDVAKTVQAFYNSLYAAQQSSPAIIAPSQDDLPSILPSEIRTALRKAKRGKAPGPDFITLEMLLAAEENAVPILASIYNECLKNERTPTSMSDSIVRLLHKKGSCLDIGNYRPVALMSTIHKIFTSILRRRAERSLEEAQPIEQTGFRPGYSTSENTLVVSEMIQKSHEYRFPLFLMFIDYKKAFDSVEFGSLWTALSEFGVHSKIVNTLKNIYDEAKVSVRIRGHDVPVQIGRGVRQGDTISPNLFNATLEHVFRRLDWSEHGISVNGTPLTHLRKIVTGEETWAKKIVEWRPWEKKRSVGRPRARWRDDFRSVLGENWSTVARNNKELFKSTMIQQSLFDYSDV
ncbi:unnamed protein product [Caenorhabditis auriculariae]|uniref:Reverse transcriptase domain-containing protein n=1 Tax=Caenorhabditis auriculariae TaxID=2777116 RepID=A0A8S1HQY2_9PELO|nr:unnamed protein product [Caenorhabditis auriculariae]